MTASGLGPAACDYSTYLATASSNVKPEANGKAEKKNAEANDTADISDVARELSNNSELDNVNATQTVEQEKLSTSEGKDAQGAKYDSYLKELREKYDEEEAISRFNEYMRSEGYEVYENVNDSTKPRATNKIIGSRINASHNGLGGDISYKYGKPLKDPIAMFSVAHGSDNVAYANASSGYRMLDTHHSSTYAVNSFTTASTIEAAMIDGKMQYNQSTWAKYNAGINSDFEKTMTFWKNRNIQELSEQAGFDVGKYVDDMSLYWGKAFAAESVSADLGNIVNRILEEVGVTLEPGRNLSLMFAVQDGKNTGLNVNIDFGDEAIRNKLQSAFDEAIKTNPGILSAFEVESSRVAEYDLDALEGAYSNGVQSNTFLQQRLFTMSGNQPSAVVMGSGLDHRQAGYVYIKKIADSFDVNADLVDVRGKSYTVSIDPEEYARMKNLMEEIRKNRQVSGHNT